MTSFDILVVVILGAVIVGCIGAFGWIYLMGMFDPGEPK